MNKSNESEGAATVMPAAPELGRLLHRYAGTGLRWDELSASAHKAWEESALAFVAALRPTAPSRSVAADSTPGETLADMFDELVRIVHDDRLEKGDRLQRIDSRIWAYRRNPAPATAFALVPLKPTAPMLTALWNLKDCDAPAQLDEAYRAMLAASPSPTSSAPAEPTTTKEKT